VARRGRSRLREVVEHRRRRSLRLRPWRSAATATSSPSAPSMKDGSTRQINGPDDNRAGRLRRGPTSSPAPA
jgi:hypothetical protein